MTAYVPPSQRAKSSVYVPRALKTRAPKVGDQNFPTLSGKKPLPKALGAWTTNIDKEKLKDLKGIPIRNATIQKVVSSSSLNEEEEPVDPDFQQTTGEDEEDYHDDTPVHTNVVDDEDEFAKDIKTLVG